MRVELVFPIATFVLTARHKTLVDAGTALMLLRVPSKVGCTTKRAAASWTGRTSLAVPEAVDAKARTGRQIYGGCGATSAVFEGCNSWVVVVETMVEGSGVKWMVKMVDVDFKCSELVSEVGVHVLV